MGVPQAGRFSCDVRNFCATSVAVPILSLKGFSRIYLRPGKKKEVSFSLTPSQLSVIDNLGRPVVEPGKYRIEAGGKQAGFTGAADPASTGVLSREVEVKAVEVK